MVTSKKRPRLDLTGTAGNRERKRGKSMFGILVGTLNKAKIEDKERNASEAAKKRQLIEQRLQAKLRKEVDSYKLRRTRLPLLSNFLLTSDTIPSEDSTLPPPTDNPLAPIPRSHPPPLFYLPAVLTPAQEAFISRRKAEVSSLTLPHGMANFHEERSTGITDIQQLRQRVADEEVRRKAELPPPEEKTETETETVPNPEIPPSDDKSASNPTEPVADDTQMEVDDVATASREKSKEPPTEHERKEDATPMQPDDDDAVEY
ncbi:hypothetical protein BD779DRAFT_1540541 [Infundibulicybe gibba]|nr:hypothetical protein BD779DRAFT_1540541 [Infundibulicybe gibba]